MLKPLAIGRRGKPALQRVEHFRGKHPPHEIGREAFAVWIIPHTHAVTALRERKVGDAVNLEGDLLGKYVERFISSTSR